MNLPDDFIQTMQDVFGGKGRQFLASLPGVIEEMSARWGLSDVRPVSNLSFNFVAFAKRSPSTTLLRSSAQDVVLKLGVRNPELDSEMAALKFFNGDGACRLLEHDEERGALLLERLKPGMMLSELQDDDERTHIAADVMQKIWRNLPPSAQGAVPAAEESAPTGYGGLSTMKFIKLSDWFNGLKRIRPHFNGGTGPFPNELLERVESFLPELFADENVKLMHGDFHHFNILSSDRGWLVIDPKGVIGPVGYEVGPFMLNPWGSISDAPRFRTQAERRVGIFSERLGWEREKIIKWSVAHAVLSAWWNIEEGMQDEYSLACAGIFSGIK